MQTQPSQQSNRVYVASVACTALVHMWLSPVRPLKWPICVYVCALYVRCLLCCGVSVVYLTVDSHPPLQTHRNLHATGGSALAIGHAASNGLGNSDVDLVVTGHGTTPESAKEVTSSILQTLTDAG